MVKLAVFGVLALSLFVAQVQARYLIVGSGEATYEEPWTEKIGEEGYLAWSKANPLYEGDCAVFLYRAYWHVVWYLPTIDEYTNCIYDEAIIFGNETAGTGKGVGVKIFAEPQYMACGILGHCEAGQKVILKATLGKLTAAEEAKAPCPRNLNDLTGVTPSPPAVVSSPPPVTASPPPKVDGPPPTKSSPPPATKSSPPPATKASPPPATKSSPPPAKTPSAPPPTGAAAPGAQVAGLLAVVAGLAAALLV